MKGQANGKLRVLEGQVGSEGVPTFPVSQDSGVVSSADKERDGICWAPFLHSRTRRQIVVSIDPAGQNGPLYQRAAYRETRVPWRKVQRFVPETEIVW